MRGGRGGMEGQILPCLVRDALARWHNLHLTCGPLLLAQPLRQAVHHTQTGEVQPDVPSIRCLLA